MSSSRSKQIVRSLVELKILEANIPGTNYPDDRIQTFPTDKQMVGALGATTGLRNLSPTSLTSHITAASKGMLPSTIKSSEPKDDTTEEPISKYGDRALSAIDKALGAGGKFYTPGVGGTS